MMLWFLLLCLAPGWIGCHARSTSTSVPFQIMGEERHFTSFGGLKGVVNGVRKNQQNDPDIVQLQEAIELVERYGKAAFDHNNIIAEGSRVVQAEFKSESELICKSPVALEESIVSVEVTVNGREFSSNAVPYRYHYPISLVSASPRMAPSVGGVTTTINLDGQVDAEMDLVCRFNTTVVSAAIVSSESLTCVVPAAHADGGRVLVDVSANGGVDYTGGPLDFYYLPGQRSETMVLTPSHGPRSGRTFIRVDGLSGLPNGNTTLLLGEVKGICRFGSVIVDASDVSPDGTSVMCVSPPYSMNDNQTAVAVDVSLISTEEALTSNGAIFLYDEPVEMFEIYPATGPLTGQTPVRINGGPFVGKPEELLCRFGDRVVPGVWQSNSELSCIVPAVGSDTPFSGSLSVPVDVSTNGIDFTSSSLVYTYHPIVDVDRLEPSHGPASGGTSVLVTGLHFEESASLVCWFGKTRATTKYLNSTSVLCMSPPALRPTTVSVHVSINGFEPRYDISQWSQNYTYEEELSITDVTPPYGPSRGNNSVLVTGGPFIDHSIGTNEMFCRFGDATVPATYISSSVISCQSPPHTATIVQLEVTQNGQDYSETDFAYEYYEDIVISHLDPSFGPSRGESNVRIYGSGFMNSSLAFCNFDDIRVPAQFVNDTEIVCESPGVTEAEMEWFGLDQITLSQLDSTQMFDLAHPYPSYLGKTVQVEVTNNAQDYTSFTKHYLFVDDIEIDSISHTRGPYSGGTPIFIAGSGFVNSTDLSCGIGAWKVKAQFLSRMSLLCFTPPQALVEADYNRTIDINTAAIRPFGAAPSTVFVEVANNGIDFTSSRRIFTYEVAHPGFYQPAPTTILPCPRGAFCSGGQRNFTLCYPGTYQPLRGQQDCLRTPIGYQSPEFGMPVPRLCPAGFVCDETGIERANKPCPAGHLCGPGTASMATTCGAEGSSFGALLPFGRKLVFGRRNSGCFDNSTSDFGLQSSNVPARYWSEMHLLPLEVDSSVAPTRGRFCLDDTCLRLEDATNLAVSDRSFDYSSTGFALRRPVPCRAGTYCNEGTAMNETSLQLLSSPNLCFDSQYCPEGSTTPRGFGNCPPGFSCQLGVREQCGVGTYCPTGSTKPKPCKPGTFNYQLGQEKCTECPQGYFCPQYGRVDPAICPPGMVCSKPGLASPNLRCPAGFFCQNGTMTSDPFRNDTTLRPYACAPGTFCLDGTGYGTVKEGNFIHAQPCPQGFFCSAASTSAKGSGPCPPGFVCPKGTATPKPAPRGHVAEYFGTIEAAACLPGTYSPTIQSDKCYPCPAGTSCEVEGLIEADICPPGTFRSADDDDVPCTSCGQGYWSKNWHLREKGECTRCPTGVICGVDGMTSPCSRKDLPTPYEPVVNLDGIPVAEYEFPASDRPPAFSVDECLRLNPGFEEGRRIQVQEFYYGELIPPYIDILGRGAHLRSSDDQNLMYSKRGRCYHNAQPDGSVLYQRMKDYYGPQIDIQFGKGGMSARQFSILATVYRLWQCTGRKG